MSEPVVYYCQRCGQGSNKITLVVRRRDCTICQDCVMEVLPLLDKTQEVLESCRELHRMQLAAISTAAVSNTEESAKKQAIGGASPYWTPAYGDVFYAISREIKERERADAAEKVNESLMACIKDHQKTILRLRNALHDRGDGRT